MRRAREGFTLVETLVALVVLAVGLLALASMNITYVRANSFAHHTSEAVVAAQSRMERLRAYATSERADNFSVFDFDYLIDTGTGFTTLADGTVVDGLLSGGSGGVARTSTEGAEYEVLFDDGAHGDGAAGDGVYGNNLTVAVAGTGGEVTLAWTVEPLPDATTGETDFARIAVDTSWTDRFGTDHEEHLESIVHRRQ